MHDDYPKCTARKKHPTMKQKPVHWADSIRPGRKGAVIIKDIVELKSGR